jgi:phosphatidylserine decarboxylase
MEISYIDRKTGKQCVEKVYGYWALSLLYGDAWWCKLLSLLFLPIVSRIPFFSKFYGYLQKRPGSKKKVAPFIQVYDVDASEFVESDFASFNDFFIRKLKPEKRPIEPDPNRLAMPADGRYLVYPEFGQFNVKGQDFCLSEFLADSAYANRYQEGAMAIIRLCPSDYHRFHFPCDGIAGRAKLINGPLYSVNPMALRKRIKILSENKRMVTEIETEKFGTILYVEVGATSVGSIHQTYTPDQPVKKGQEKGFFEFGGSCIVLFFEKGQVQFDDDLILNTQKGFETLAQFGQSLASSKK